MGVERLIDKAEKAMARKSAPSKPRTKAVSKSATKSTVKKK